MHRKIKGASLTVLAFLILTLLSLALGILLLFGPDIIDILNGLIAVPLTTVSMNLRGMAILLTWQMYWWIIGIVALVMFAFGTTCKSWPIGTAICAAAFISFMVALASILGLVQEEIPLVIYPAPNFYVGSEDKGATSDQVAEKIADRVYDCWKMFGRGKYDPLAGHTPPNPRTCFIGFFNIKSGDALSISKIKEKIKEEYGKIPLKFKGMSYGEVCQHGTVYIKYADTYPIWISWGEKWGDEDCEIHEKSTISDTVFICFKDLSGCLEESSSERFAVCYLKLEDPVNGEEKEFIINYGGMVYFELVNFIYTDAEGHTHSYCYPGNPDTDCIPEINCFECYKVGDSVYSAGWADEICQLGYEYNPGEWHEITE